MIKKLLPFIISVFLVSISSYAQPIILGLKGGLDLTKLNGQSFASNYSTSFNAGAYMSSNFNARWGWQTEIVYNQGNEATNSTGFNEVYSTNSGANNSTLNSYATIGAITIPFLITYKINNFFSLNAGPQFSYNVYTDQNMFINGEVPFKQTDFWACIGGKLDLGGVNFYVRYNNGFTDINKTGRDTWKNRQINFGLEVPILKKGKNK